MTSFKPDGWPTIIPRIFTRDVAGLARFVKAVFDAKGDVQAARPTELRIGNSLLMISDGDGIRDPTPAFLYIYVADTDTAYRRAIAAGAETVEQPMDMLYGDRRATVRDRWGNFWQIATHRGR